MPALIQTVLMSGYLLVKFLTCFGIEARSALSMVYVSRPGRSLARDARRSWRRPVAMTFLP